MFLHLLNNANNIYTVSNQEERMKNAGLIIFLVITVLLLSSCETPELDGTIVKEGVSGSGIILDKKTLTLTIGAGERLGYTIGSDIKRQTLIWTSSDSNIASVSSNGTVTAVNFSSGQHNNRYNTGGTADNPTTNPATGTAVITVRTNNNSFSDTITITTTTQPQVNMMTLPPLKDQFAGYFLIGNILRGPSEITGTGTSAVINNPHLTRHFNAITAENHMKPGYLITGRDAATGMFTWNSNNQATADNFVDAANNAGMKVIGHTLLWHSQNANWMWNQIASRAGVIAADMDKEKAIIIMKEYITEVVSRYKGKIHTWDVLNEIFPDNASSNANWKDAMRRNASGEGQDANPWYVAIGSDFVYEGFLAARLADPNAILYYNDYNTDMSNRARLIRDMVQEVNNKYLTGTDKPAGENPGRLLIEGIGMQEHHNNGISASSIRNTINMFRPLGVRLSVSELDIIAYPNYGAFSGAGGAEINQNHNSTVTNQALITQANLYGEYMKLYIENSDIIERISIWGVIDNLSWRSRGLPLLFDHSGKAKPAYYRFVGALNN